MNPAITDYIENIKHEWQKPICQQLRQLIHKALPAVEERLQYGKPHFMKAGKYAYVMGTAKEWVTLTIFNATDLQPPSGFFEESDVTERRTIKIRQGQTVDYALLAQFVQQTASA
jgi:hypothetical protein